MLRQVVMVGAGQAAAQAIDTLRRRGFDGSIALVGEEPLEPYQRPPLSKAYLAGAVGLERLMLRPARFYQDHRVELRLGVPAVAIDPRERIVRLADGGDVPFEALLLATGSRPRRLRVAGTDLDGVYFLRTAADAQRMREALHPGRHLVVVGGGYIGLEVAATCRDRGLDVTVLEAADRLLSRVCAPPVCAFYESEHRRQGVHVVCNARVRAIVPASGSRRVGSVVSESGTYPADLVLVAVGVAPADELAAAAGLECSGGVIVDERGRTAHPGIHAAGDCTVQWRPRYGRRIHLESVDNAFEQGAGAALDLLGAPSAQDKVPWFWSDQFDLKLVIVGLADGADRVVLRGAPQARSFSVCHLKAGELLAIETVNRAQDQIAARRLIAARARFEADRLADPAIPLAQCALAPPAQSAK
jgi:3-phenylpropionate/trans-cinnamate dioxygenase ferredoxin reductase component